MDREAIRELCLCGLSLTLIALATILLILNPLLPWLDAERGSPMLSISMAMGFSLGIAVLGILSLIVPDPSVSSGLFAGQILNFLVALLATWFSLLMLV